MSQTAPKQRYVLFALALVALLSGCVLTFLDYSGHAKLPWGILLLPVGVALMKASNVRGLMGLFSAARKNDSRQSPKRPGPLAWAVVVVSMLALGISFHYLYKDAVHGYHGIWPVYFFAGSTVLCIVAWGYIISKTM